MRTLIFAVSFLFSICSHSQTGKLLFSAETLLFPAFESGKVLLKNGRIESALMNYNTDAQNIVFVQGDQYLVLTGLEQVDTIFIQKRKFIPVANTVCEVIGSEANWTLLSIYTAKRTPLTATTDKNGTSKKPASEVANTVTDVYVGRNYQENTAFQMVPQFFLRYKGKMYRVANKKQLLRSLAPEHKEAVASFLDTNNIDFDSVNDMLGLLHVVAKER